jgi:hypothetical protein
MRKKANSIISIFALTVLLSATTLSGCKKKDVMPEIASSDATAENANMEMPSEEVAENEDMEMPGDEIAKIISFEDFTDKFTQFTESINIEGFNYVGHAAFSEEFKPDAAFGKRSRLTVDGSDNWGLSSGRSVEFASYDDSLRIDVNLLYTQVNMGRDYMGQIDLPRYPTEVGFSLVCFDNLLAVIVTTRVFESDFEYPVKVKNIDAVISVNKALLKVYGS